VEPRLLKADPRLYRAMVANGRDRARDFDVASIARKWCDLLEHEVAPHHVTFIRQNTLPRTSSGKVQRHLCRLGLERGTLDVVAERGNGAAPSS